MGQTLPNRKGAGSPHSLEAVGPLEAMSGVISKAGTTMPCHRCSQATFKHVLDSRVGRRAEDVDAGVDNVRRVRIRVVPQSTFCLFSGLWLQQVAQPAGIARIDPSLFFYLLSRNLRSAVITKIYHKRRFKNKQMQFLFDAATRTP